MLNLPPSVKVYMATEATDMRKAINSLSLLTQEVLEKDPFSGHLFVFCNYTSVENKEIDNFLELSAKTQNINMNVLQGYGDFMKEKINGMEISEQHNWTKRQTYIALTNLLTACAELKIDACPMEGFETEKYNEILGLSEKGLNAAVIAPIGYRSKNDDAQYRKKVRKPLTELFEVI